MDNRFQRRHPEKAQTEEKEIPVKIIIRADGSQDVILPDSVICGICSCCKIWIGQLQNLRDGANFHFIENHQAEILFPGFCRICWIASGGIPTPPGDLCPACKCCVLWWDKLTEANNSIEAHVKEGHNKANRFPDDCPICWIAGGAIDGGDHGI